MKERLVGINPKTKKIMNKSIHCRYLLLFFILLVIPSCKDKQIHQVQKEKVHVKVTWPLEVELVIPITSSGKLYAGEETKLSFKTGGIIKHMEVNEGDKVKKGQVLAELDLSEIRSLVNQAKQQVEKYKRDYARIKNLYEDSAATLEQFQDIQTALEVAQSEYSIALFNLEHSIIKAPSNGTILKKLKEENELIGQGHPVFLFASSDKNWIVKTEVTDKDIVHIDKGDSCLVEFDAYPGEKFRATISGIGAFANPYTGTFTLELEVLSPPKNLVSGFIARATIYPSISHSTYAIPYATLSSGTGRDGYVFIAKNGRAIKKKVHIIMLSDSIIFINRKNAPFSGNDSLITDGVNYLQDSSLINITR